MRIRVSGVLWGGHCKEKTQTIWNNLEIEENGKGKEATTHTRRKGKGLEGCQTEGSRN